MDLQALIELERAATPAPWKSSQSSECPCVYSEAAEPGQNLVVTAACSGLLSGDIKWNHDDLELIAAMRNVAPSLLAEILATRRLLANLRRIVAAWQSYKLVRILYRNWKGETAERLVLFRHPPYFGSNEWHKEPQWLVHCEDQEKYEPRTFAVADILEWVEDTP